SGNAWLYLATLTAQVIRQAEGRASLVTQQVFFQAQNALADAAEEGKKPASAGADDIREYVRAALDGSSALTSLIDAEVATPGIYEVTVVDRNNTVLISSDASLPGSTAFTRPPLSQLVNGSFFQQLRVIFGPAQSYQVAYPFVLGPPGQQLPFGEIRVAVQT